MAGQVAQTIVDQLGGVGILHAMIGAHHIMAVGDNSLHFRFKGSKKINCAVISLNSMDLYDITFYMLRGLDAKTVKQIDGIYAEDMKRIFEETTGLYLSL